MVRTLLLLVLLIWNSNMNAQNIQSISIQPQFPGPTDSVYVIIDLMFTSGSCEMTHQNHTVSNDSIRINVFHCPGALTVICNTADTINLGLLSPNNYTMDVIVNTSSWSAPDPCTDINPTDSNTVQFTVLPGTGLSEPSSVKNLIYYHSKKGSLISTIPELNSILLFNSLGKLVLEENFSNSNSVKLPTLAEGIYFYKVQQKDGLTESGKVLIY